MVGSEVSARLRRTKGPFRERRSIGKDGRSLAISW